MDSWRRELRDVISVEGLKSKRSQYLFILIDIRE
jgi:hypothetical protein